MAYYGITKESQLIDMAAINAGCDVIDTAAEDFVKSGKIVGQAADTCGKDAMSVDGKTMQPSLEELSEQIIDLKNSVTGFTAQIRSVTSRIYSQQSQELQNYQEEMRKKKLEGQKK